MKKKALAAILTCSLVASIFVGCGTSSSSSSGKITLTILSQHTDFVNTKFKEYQKEYEKINPNVTLKFEAYTDYDNATKTRMSSSDYGDVLLIPSTIQQKDYPNYFTALGDESTLAKKYYGLDGAGALFGGKIYGIPSEMNVSGMVYNKKVFKEAGITKLPTSEDEFLQDMKLIKDKTSATPYYTNFKDKWPLTQFQPDTLSVAGNTTYSNIDMVNDDSPFSAGKPYYVTYKLLYDVTKSKLIENDPTSTDWETSKTMMAQGKIGCMELGSWAITQIQAQASNKDDIGFMPYPHSINGQVYTQMSADYSWAVNKNSKNVDAAKQFVTWIVEKSTYAADNGGVPTLKSAAMPSALQDFKATGVKFLIADPAKKDQAGWSNKIDNAGQVGIGQPDFEQKIIESALGNSSESYDQIMSDLNTKWKAGRDSVKAGN